jgi:hypothetical protein
MCPTPDSTLADPHQISADLQRQLAECRAERDEALARETAMAEVLQVINSSPGGRQAFATGCLLPQRRTCRRHKGSNYRDRHHRGCAPFQVSPRAAGVLAVGLPVPQAVARRRPISPPPRFGRNRQSLRRTDRSFRAAAQRRCVARPPARGITISLAPTCH